MIEMGQRLPRGNHPNLHWHIGKAEDTFPQPPYSLITAGESLHWMDWETILPHFAKILESNGYLVMLGIRVLTAWDKDLTEIIREYSTTQDFLLYNLTVELQQRQLFQALGSNSSHQKESLNHSRTTLNLFMAELHFPGSA